MKPAPKSTRLPKSAPSAIFQAQAKIAAGNKLIARVTVLGDTTLGEGNVIFPGACLGGGPQDHGNEFQPGARLIIGSHNVIRENVTMHAGTPKGADPDCG